MRRPWLEFGVMFTLIFITSSECPRECECKWRSGKESVLCNYKNFTAIPSGLDPGTQLLDLTGNNLSSIRKDEFSSAELLNLQRIFLSRCSLRIIHKFAFRNLSNLVDLDLSYNLLATVPSHAFSSTPEIRELKLNGNPIDKVLNNSFRSVPRINKLDLSECRIVFIDTEAFAGLEASLEWLKLDKNRLMSIRAPCLTILKNLHGLELAGNPWHCLCALRPLREWILKGNIPHNVSPSCATPERLSGRLWDRLDLDEFACTPRVVALETSTYGEEGTNITLSCTVRSIPTATVRWFRKNQVIGTNSTSNGRHYFLLHNNLNGSHLTITSVESGDTGAYTCVAENKAGRTEARIQLLVSLRPPEKQWTTRVVVGTTAVVVLFSIAAALLVICVCSLKKRRNFPTHSVATDSDTYEMNNKVDYQKVHGNATNTVSEMNLRNGIYLGGADHESGFPSDISKNSIWTSPKDDRDSAIAKLPARLSPDLHIPRLQDLRPTEEATSTTVTAIDLPGIKSHVLRKEVTEKRGTLYTTYRSTDNYPDLLEPDKNTLPRYRSSTMHHPKRTRTGSFGSESLSPLLQGSSDESCDIADKTGNECPTTAELDRFLAEYRSLQEQLYKMKESCENLTMDNLRFSGTSEPKTISGLMDTRNVTVEPCYGMVSPAVEPLYSVTQHLISDHTINSALLNNTTTMQCASQNITGEDLLNTERLFVGGRNEPHWLTRSKFLNTLSDPCPRNSAFLDS